MTEMRPLSAACSASRATRSGETNVNFGSRAVKYSASLAFWNPDGTRGVIAHRFYGSDDGQIMVIDEWPDEQSFQTFFQEQQEPIGSMMQEAGVTSEPQVRFWRKLDTHDEIGWDS